MADWFTSKRKVTEESSDLSSPLLPHGTEDNIKNNERTSSQKQRDITTAFAAYAVANAPIPATSTHHHHNHRQRSSNLSTRHSRQRLNKMKRYASNLSRQLSDVSTASSDITHQMHNINSSITATYSRTESEITDYGGIGQSTDGKNDRHGPSSSADIIDKSQPNNEAMSSETKAKVSIVILLTSCGIGAYIAAFISSIVVAGTAAADSVVIGIAGATSIFISTPLVWISEWRLTHLPLLRSSINRMRELAMRFQSELDILVLEKESLREEVEE